MPPQRAAFPTVMPVLSHQIGRTNPLAIEAHQSVGYPVLLPYVTLPNQWPGYNYLMPITKERLQEQGRSFTPLQGYNGPMSQYTPLGIQNNISLDMEGNQPPAMQGSMPLAMEGNLPLNTPGRLSFNARGDSHVGLEGNLPLGMDVNLQEQNPRRHVQSHARYGTTRRSAATREYDSSVRLSNSGDPSHNYTRSGRNDRRRSAAVHMVADLSPTPAYTTRQVNQLGQVQSHPRSLPRQSPYYKPDYIQLDREHELALDEESPTPARYMGSRT